MDKNTVELNAKGEEKKEVRETSIDVHDDFMTVVIDLRIGRVNCYGTLMYAQEMGSRFYTTKEIQIQKMMNENKKTGIIIPRG